MNEKYLVIAGTNKAGTTSFYEYLAAHPAVSAAFIKQTFFFLDKEWQQKLDLKSLYDYEKGFEQFDQFFRNHTPGQHKLEGSPEYLYAPGTPQRLFDFLSTHNGEILFILRNPVSRFISLFYFGKQLGLINAACTFHEFIEQSKNHRGNTNTSLMAFETGFYSRYLENYIHIFGRQKIRVYFFEDMMADTKSFMQQVSNDIGLDPSFYDDFTFQLQNKTVAVKNELLGKWYLSARASFIEHTYKSKAGFYTGSLLKKMITPLYKKLNTASLEKQQIDAADKTYLEDIYKSEKEKLEQLLGIKVPWQ